MTKTPEIDDACSDGHPDVEDQERTERLCISLVIKAASAWPRDDAAMPNEMRADYFKSPAALETVESARLDIAGRTVEGSCGAWACNMIRGKPAQTTTRSRAVPCPFDHVNRRFNASHPKAHWACDSSHVAAWTGVVRVAFVIDACVRRIAGWRVGLAPAMGFTRACGECRWSKGSARRVGAINGDGLIVRLDRVETLRPGSMGARVYKRTLLHEADLADRRKCRQTGQADQIPAEEAGPGWLGTSTKCA